MADTARRRCRHVAIAACCLVGLGMIGPVWGDWLPEQRASHCLFQCDPTASNQSAIAVDADNRIHVVWVDDRNSSDLSTNEVRYRKYTPGEGWEGEVRLTFPELDRQDDEGKEPAPTSVSSIKGSAGVVVDSENNVYVSFENLTHRTANVVRIDAVSGSPSAPEVLDEAGLTDPNPSLAADGNQVHAVWVGMEGDQRQIFYRMFKPGRGWGGKELITSYESDKRRPTLAVDPSGTVHLVWEDSRCRRTNESEAVYYGICYSKSITAGSWETVTSLTDLIGSFDAEQPHIVADAAGNLHVAWQDSRPEHGAGNSEIYYRRHDAASGDWMPEQRITDALGSSSSPHLAADPSGQIHLLWFDINATTGQYVPFYRKRTTDWGDRVRLARTGYRGSMVADAGSGLHIAYRAPVAGRGQQVHYLEFDPNFVAEASAREVMLVVDVSGSMALSADGTPSAPAEQSRLDMAGQALSNFLDRFQLRNSPQAEFGLVSFPDPEKSCPSAAVDIALTALTEESRDKTITVDIPGLEMPSAGALTPLVEGLKLANEHMTTSSEKGILVLVSDGRHNCPGVNFPADFPDNLKYPVYAAGIGTTAAVDPRLADIASETGGGYVNATAETPEDLMTWAKDVIVTVMGLEAEMDPAEQITAGEIQRRSARITDHDTNIAFGLSWSTPAKDRIGFKLRTPGGRDITPMDAKTLSGVTHLSRPTYQIYYLSENFLRDIKRAGEWTLEFSGQHLDRGAVELYRYDVTMESSLKMLPEFTRRGYRTGDEIGLQITFLESGHRLPAEVYVKVHSPQEGVGNWFAANSKAGGLAFDADTKEPMGDSTNLARVARSIIQAKGEFSPTRMKTKMRLVDDGTQGDLLPGDGVYAGVFSDTRVPGTYSFEILATGKTSAGQPFRRHRVIQRLVAVNVQRAHTAVGTSNVDENQYDMTITPMDKWGNHLGPGYADRIAFVIEGARSVSAVRDHLDGRYSQRFAMIGSDHGDCTPVRAFVQKAEMTFCARFAR